MEPVGELTGTVRPGTSARVEVRLLGGFELAIAGAHPRNIGITSKRQRALLSYLALQPDFAESRERLALLIFGDSDDGSARKRCRQTLLRLRRELGNLDILEGDRDRVAIRSDGVFVDARAFLALASSSDQGDAEAAAALCRGELLAGLHLDSEEFDGWLRAERRRVSTAAATVFERCAEQREQQGNIAGAIEAVERLIALDVGDESAQRRLITLLARHRGRSAALTHADAVVREIREQFDSAVEPETAALIEEIRSAPREAPGLARLSASIDRDPLQRAQEQEQEQGQERPDPAGQRVAWYRATARRLWMPAAALVALAAFGSLALDLVRLGSSTATTPDARVADTWRSPLRPAQAVSKAVEGRGISALLVLPFTASAVDSAESLKLARQISAELTSDLSRVPGLRVIARTTAMHFAGRPFDAAQLGTELGVQYIVEGDVRSENDRVKVNIALIDTSTRLQVWTARYEREEADRPSILEEIVRALARQLQVSLMEVRGLAAARSHPTVDALLAKGWAELNQFAFFRGGRDAGTHFENALAIDPRNVSALTGLGAFKSTAYNTRQTENPAGLLDEAEALLKQAIALNPHASLPVYFLGRVAMWRGQAEEALARFTETVELNPSYAPAYGAIGYVLLHTGQNEQARDNLMYAIRLSPKDHYVGLWSNHLGRAYFELGQVADAERWLSQAVALMPKSTLNRAALAAFYAAEGNQEAAAVQAREIAKLVPAMTAEELSRRFTLLCKPGEYTPQRLLAGLQSAWQNEQTP